GGVGYELTQEDLALGVDRVHHQVQQARDLRLIGMALASRAGIGIRLRHRLVPVRLVIGAEFRVAAGARSRTGRRDAAARALPSAGRRRMADFDGGRELARSARSAPGGWGAENPKPLFWTGARGNDHNPTGICGATKVFQRSFGGNASSR